MSCLTNNLYAIHSFPILTGSTKQHVAPNIGRRKGRYCMLRDACL